ncbi:unnamed protein product, partial [Rotaria sp. Silwood2]
SSLPSAQSNIVSNANTNGIQWPDRHRYSSSLHSLNSSSSHNLSSKPSLQSVMPLQI